jgi:hypothetical protein
MPAFCAARQTRISPSPRIMPHNPSDGDPLPQAYGLEIPTIGVECRLRIRSVIRILEEGPRHIALCKSSQIVNACYAA